MNQNKYLVSSYTVKVRENKSAYYLSETCARLSQEHASVAVSERVNFQSSSMLHWLNASQAYQIIFSLCFRRV